MKIILNIKALLSLPFVLLLLAITACNRDFDNKLIFKTDADTTVSKSQNANKVLYIMVDGGVGTVLEAESQKDDINPNLNALTKSALYTGGSVADTNTYLPATYADMLTGVYISKHKVHPGVANNLAAYPTFIERVIQSNPTVTAAAYIRSQYIYDNLATGASTKEVLTSDDAVQTAAVANLKTDNNDIVLVQYQGLYDAGQQYGYGPRSPQYVAAVNKLDNFIGSLRSAIAQRPNYNFENWLIIVASNKGGAYQLYDEEITNSVFSQPYRNAFVLFSNNKFAAKYYPKPDVINYQQEGYTIGNAEDANYPNTLGPSSTVGNIPAADAAIYNFGTSGSYTVQFKANFKSLGSNSPTIIAKSSGSGGNNPAGGWAIQLSGGKMRLRIANATYFGNGPVETLNVWNTYTMRVYDSASKRYTSLHINGVPYGPPADITGKDVSAATDNLRIGGGPSFGEYSPRLNLVDIRIYNTALPDAFIRANYCSTLVNPEDSYYNNLIGYWPAMGLDPNERLQGKFIDLSVNKKDVVFTGLEWTGIALSKTADICPTIPFDLHKTLPQPVDVPLFIYMWMNVRNIPSLGLDGISWLPSFTN